MDDLSQYITISGLLTSYMKYKGCKTLSELVDKINSETGEESVSINTIKKWSDVDNIPSDMNLIKLFIDEDYYKQAQKLRRKLLKERKFEREQKKLLHSDSSSKEQTDEPIVDNSDYNKEDVSEERYNELLNYNKELQQTIKELVEEKGFNPDVIPLPKHLETEEKLKNANRYAELINIYDDDMDISNEKPFVAQEMDEKHANMLKYSYIEKATRLYDYSGYITDMALSDYETKIIEKGIYLLFDKNMINTFRRSISRLMANYAVVDEGRYIFASNYQSKTKGLDFYNNHNKFIKKASISIVEIIDRFLKALGNKDIISSIKESEKNYIELRKDWCHDRDKWLSIGDYRERLVNHRMSLKRGVIPELETADGISLTLKDIYSLCTKCGTSENPYVVSKLPLTVNDKWNNYMLFDKYSKNSSRKYYINLPDRLKKWVLLDYLPFPVNDYPNGYQEILDKFVTKEYTFPEKKGLFGKKEEGVCYISLELTPLGKEFIKWYESFFIDNQKHGVLIDTIPYSGGTMGIYYPLPDDSKDPHSLEIIDDIEKTFCDGWNHPYALSKIPGFYKKDIFLSKNVKFDKHYFTEYECYEWKPILVMGCVGSGKTYGYARKNILNMTNSYIVTDINDELYNHTSEILKNNGYNIIKVSIKDGLYFNPIKFGLVDNIVRSIFAFADKENKEENKFFGFDLTNEKILLSAIISYVVYYEKDDKKNFKRVLEILQDDNRFDYLFTETTLKNEDIEYCYKRKNYLTTDKYTTNYISNLIELIKPLAEADTYNDLDTSKQRIFSDPEKYNQIVYIDVTDVNTYTDKVILNILLTDFLFVYCQRENYHFIFDNFQMLNHNQLLADYLTKTTNIASMSILVHNLRELDVNGVSKQLILLKKPIIVCYHLTDEDDIHYIHELLPKNKVAVYNELGEQLFPELKYIIEESEIKYMPKEKCIVYLQMDNQELRKISEVFLKPFYDDSLIVD